MDYMKAEIDRYKWGSGSGLEDAPSLNEEGCYGSNGPQVLLHTSKGFLDEAVAPFGPLRGKEKDTAVMNAVGAALALFKAMQELWSHVISTEVQVHRRKAGSSRSSRKIPPSRPPHPCSNFAIHHGFVSRTITLANDQLKCAELLESYWGDAKQMLFSRSDQAVLDEWMITAIEGYIALSKQCLASLVSITLLFAKPSLKTLFQEPWYQSGGTVMLAITQQIDIALSTSQSYLHPTLFEALAGSLLDAFLVMYLTALCNVKTKLRMPEAVELVKQDVRVAFQFFAGLKQAELNEFDVMEMLLPMLEVQGCDLVRLLVPPYWAFARRFGPNLDFVEALSRSRGDVSKAVLKEAMSILRGKVKSERMANRTCSSCTGLYMVKHKVLANHPAGSQGVIEMVVLPKKLKFGVPGLSPLRKLAQTRL